MIRITFSLALLLFSAFSCAHEEVATSKPLDAIPAYIAQVDAPATAAVGEVVPIEVAFVVNNGCGYFGRFETIGTGADRTIKVYASYRDGPCFQALVTLKQKYEFKPTVKGTYFLRFYVEPDKYISTVISVGEASANK